MEDIKTDYDAMRYMRGRAREIGFSHFMVARAAGPADRRLGDLVRISSWPPELLMAYDDAGLLRSSTVSDEVTTHALPVWWDLAERDAQDTAEESKTCFDMFADHDMCRHLAFTVSDGTGTRWVVSFSGSGERPDDPTTNDLHLMAVHLVERLRVINPNSENRIHLTDRQAEVMQLIAAGKTSDEIGVILGISDRTVDGYAAEACQRLDSVTRAQAVAEAIRQGMI